jgi:hypothetical protein
MYPIQKEKQDCEHLLNDPGRRHSQTQHQTMTLARTRTTTSEPSSGFNKHVTFQVISTFWSQVNTAFAIVIAFTYRDAITESIHAIFPVDEHQKVKSAWIAALVVTVGFTIYLLLYRCVANRVNQRFGDNLMPHHDPTMGDTQDP